MNKLVNLFNYLIITIISTAYMTMIASNDYIKIYLGIPLSKLFVPFLLVNDDFFFNRLQKQNSFIFLF